MQNFGFCGCVFFVIVSRILVVTRYFAATPPLIRHIVMAPSEAAVAGVAGAIGGCIATIATYPLMTVCRPLMKVKGRRERERERKKERDVAKTSSVICIDNPFLSYRSSSGFAEFVDVLVDRIKYTLKNLLYVKISHRCLQRCILLLPLLCHR